MVTRRRTTTFVLSSVIVLLLWPVSAKCQQQTGIDLEAWHEQFIPVDEAPEEFAEPEWLGGIYPSAGAALGLPDIVSGQAHLYVSLRHRDTFGLFAGYGREWGSPADGEVFTLGWGGVRAVPVASRQRGFYGKFLRYRRWEDDDHGDHEGLSIGTESGAGYFGLAFEIGAARSGRNHWLLVAQVVFKIALPIGIVFG